MSKPAEKLEKHRLSAEDWEQAALELIREQGVTAVAVEPLAKRLGVTKGSFYWHFANRDALIQGALDRWEKNDIRTFTRTIDLINDPHDKMRAFFLRTRKETDSHVVFSALFRAVDHPLVKPFMQRVSERRIEFLTQGYVELGLSETVATNRARLTFMSYVGFLQYYQNFKEVRMSLEQLDAYVEHVIATLIP